MSRLANIGLEAIQQKVAHMSLPPFSVILISLLIFAGFIIVSYTIYRLVTH